MAKESHPDLSLRLSQVPLDRRHAPSGHQTPPELLPIYAGEVYSQRVVNWQEGASASFSPVKINDRWRDIFSFAVVKNNFLIAPFKDTLPTLSLPRMDHRLVVNQPCTQAILRESGKERGTLSRAKASFVEISSPCSASVQ